MSAADVMLLPGDIAVPVPVLTAVATCAIATIVLFLLFGGKPKPALDPVEFTPLPLVKKESLSHDTRRFTFGLPNGPNGILGLPVGQHITLKFTETLADGSKKNHQRSYTPTTGDDTPGTVTFVIKVYKAGVHPKFPEGGKMSQHLDSLKIGDTVDMRGPKGHMTYHKNGKFTVHPILKKDPPQQRAAKHFGMIAGGTGITPMLQVMHAVLRDEPNSNVTISLLYANQSEDDILVRQELEEAVEKYDGRFQLHYTVDRAPEGWKYSTGFITKDMIEKHLPGPSSDGSTQILMCGPPPMIKFACLPNLEALGFKKTDYFTF
jgi:cytochrome-b5 reductase